jgi:hypothetical protein
MKQDNKDLTVKEFINILKKNVKDIDIANVEFMVGEKSYKLKSVGQFQILPDVIIELEEYKPPLMRIVKNFRRDKRKMIKEHVKEIK